eukprot:12175628-Alexandrium_andersonii.AAC.1
MEFVIKVYRSQLERRAYLLHEHPATAVSWDQLEMRKLLGEPQVNTVIGLLCRFGSRVSEPARTGVGG